MHEIAFADAAIPTPAECLGLPLANYCLRHELVLLRHRSPFLCASEAEFNHLPKPVQVFAVSFAAQQCASRKPGYFWHWRRHDYALAIAEFRNYITAGRKLMPSLSSADDADKETYEIANAGEKMSGGRPLGSPLLAQLIHFCINDLRLTYEDALESPFAHVGNLYFAKLEAAGSLYIENHKEAEVRAEMVRQRAEVKALNDEARKQLSKARTPEARAEAYALNPRIGNLFAQEWYAASTDEQRDALVEKWGTVAETELAKAGITRKETCQD
ncbi:MAG: hypothetical protein WCS94_16760 [Verrucomicrobiota bacterium]